MTMPHPTSAGCARAVSRFSRSAGLALWLVWLLTAATNDSSALETVRFLDGDSERTESGRLLVEARDGGVMLQSPDGRIWTLPGDQVIDRSSDELSFSPLTPDEMEEQLRSELPPQFEIFRTGHYIVAYNSNEAHARRVAALFEQLYSSFNAYWKNQRWKLPEPEFPLVALVLNSRADFLRYAGAQIGGTAKSIIGYYHLGTNRMVTYRVDNFERNIATILHEATHQLAYNRGLQRRFADNPMWVSEGLAMYFEAPKRRNSKKWTGIGGLNQVKLADLRRYFPHRPQESLVTLLADDHRFRSPATAGPAYAEAWALTYFLIRTRRKQYVKYLQQLSESTPLVERTPQERIAMFEEAFDTTIEKLDRQFVRYMRSR